jgi:hypothetical protein
MDKKKLLKTLTAGRGAILVPHIEAYQARGKFPETWDIEIRNYKESDKHFHPSSHCFAYPRDIWLAMQDRLIYPKVTPALRRTFDCGHMWHGYLQAMLVEMGFVHPDNVERKLQHKIVTHRGECIGSGTADLVDVEIPGHGKWLVDIKTMSKPEFEAGASEYTFKKWDAQVSCYMDWLGVSKAMVLAICKDSPHQMREYQIVKNVQLLNEIYDRWTYVAEHVRTGVDPGDEYEYQVDPLLLNPGDSVFDLVDAEKVQENEKALS